MKSCVYLENPEVKAYIKSLNDGVGEEASFDSVFVRANNKFNLPHDDLAEAMYIAKEAGTDDANVKTLLSTPQENLLRQAYLDGQIDESYLERWMSDQDVARMKAAKKKADAEK